MTIKYFIGKDGKKHFTVGGMTYCIIDRDEIILKDLPE